MDILAVSLHFECWMQGGIIRALLLKCMYIQSVSLSYNFYVHCDSL